MSIQKILEKHLDVDSDDYGSFSVITGIPEAVKEIEEYEKNKHCNNCSKCMTEDVSLDDTYYCPVHLSFYPVDDINELKCGDWEKTNGR